MSTQTLPHCLGLLKTTLHSTPSDILPSIFALTSTQWICIEPSKNQWLVFVPSIPTPIGHLSSSLSSAFFQCILAPMGFGPVGGWIPSSPIPNGLLIEGLIHVQVKFTATFELALLLFCAPKMVEHYFRNLLLANIIPKRPTSYDPQLHLGCPLATIPHNNFLIQSITKPQISNSYNPSLITIPSGLDLPAQYPSPSIISTQLLDYQAQGLAFLLDRESPESLSARALWNHSINGQWHVWEHKISLETIGFDNPSTYPEAPLGSILADDMGLGKSLQAISLIGSTLINANQFSQQPSTNSHHLSPHQATLIICPPRLLSNWENEITKHSHDGAILFLSYHGRERHKISHQLISSVKVILTTYPTITTEFLKINDVSSNQNFSLIYSRYWFRIILDEAQ